MELLEFSAIMTLLTLTALEIVLGIDNVIFIGIVVQRLPEDQQKKARIIGLTLAMIMRIILLLGIVWIMGLTQPLMTVYEFELSLRDLILIAGGLFLIYQSTSSIHEDVTGEKQENLSHMPGQFAKVITQIIVLDFVFSLDSIITAIGMTENVTIIIIAMVIAMIIMLASSGWVVDFIKQHATVKMLALCFILMIGTFLIAEGLHFHVPRGYIYFAFSFSILVETLNIFRRKKALRAKHG